MGSFKRIFPVLTVLFLGYLGYSLVLPLFPPMFLTTKFSFLPPSTTIGMRKILLGVLFAMYPMGQFLGAPLLGKLSDKYGRRPILLLSLLLVIPTYIGSALSVSYTLPLFLYLSRFFSGLLEGNIVIAQAAIADISENTHTKAKNFGWLVSLGSTAFFFGPLIGGKLADPKIVSWFDYPIPFWGAAALTLIGFFIVYKMFRETHIPNREIELSFKTITGTFIKGLKIKKLRVLYSANFILFTGIFFFLNFFSAYLVDRFRFSVSTLGEVNSYLSIPFIISPFFFGVFSKWWTSRQAMRFGALFLCISLLVFVIPTSPWALLLTLLPIGFFMAMGFAFPAIMVSDTASEHAQGEALGTNQSLQVLAEGGTALIGGVIMTQGNNYPIYAAAFFTAFAGLILFIRNPSVD